VKTYFIFHDHWYQYRKADLVAARVPFDGFIVVRRRRAWWGQYLWRRIKRLGVLKVIDEVALRVFWNLTKAGTDDRTLRAILEQAVAELPEDYERPPIHHIDNINGPEGQARLRELAPDVCVVMLNVMLRESVFTIPRLGMLVYHPGVTPEYRGPHSAFWAMLNNELWGIGWSLLTVDRGIDTGTVLAQSSAYTVDPLNDTHVLMQHKAHIEGMPAVADVLRRLAAGERPEVEMVDRRSTNYTHPGLSDYVRLRTKLRAIRAGTAKPGAPKPAGVG
jgi:hypothetical protein